MRVINYIPLLIIFILGCTNKNCTRFHKGVFLEVDNGDSTYYYRTQLNQLSITKDNWTVSDIKWVNNCSCKYSLVESNSIDINHYFMNKKMDVTFDPLSKSSYRYFSKVENLNASIIQKVIKLKNEINQNRMEIIIDSLKNINNEWLSYEYNFSVKYNYPWITDKKRIINTDNQLYFELRNYISNSTITIQSGKDIPLTLLSDSIYHDIIISDFIKKDSSCKFIKKSNSIINSNIYTLLTFESTFNNQKSYQKVFIRRTGLKFYIITSTFQNDNNDFETKLLPESHKGIIDNISFNLN